jgi:hypothetical protein
MYGRFNSRSNGQHTSVGNRLIQYQITENLKDVVDREMRITVYIQSG